MCAFSGALFASIGCMEVFCSLVGNFIFNPIYYATLSFWPAFVFFVMAICAFLSLVITA